MNDLGFWMAMFTLGALAYFETPLGRLIRAGARALWATVRPVEEEDEPEPERRPRRRLFIRRANGQLAGSLPSRSYADRNDRNGDEDHFSAVSGIATPHANAETIAFLYLARLIAAGHVTETQALEAACEVKAGSSKAYQDARAKLKRALEQVR
jgi:hypothetical protein